MIRVAIADDLDMIRTGFELIVNNEPDMAVVASVANGSAIIAACQSSDIDVVLMDIRMPGLDGLTATKEIVKQPNPPNVVILTTFGLDYYVATAIVAGAAGFLLKDASAVELIAAIRSVAAGEAVLAPSLVRSVFERARVVPVPGEVPGIDDLTDREREVLEQLAGGRSNAEIGEQLFLSEATVKTHVSHIFTKLGVRDRVQAVIAAFNAGIVQPGRSPGSAGSD
ncbi:MAG: response regulator transcription factor [Acidimicrobiales bacterium]